MNFITYIVEYHRYMNIIGLGVVLGTAFLLSFDRSAIKISLIIRALLFQMALALICLRTSVGEYLMHYVASAVGSLTQAADSGISFVFGALSKTTGAWGFIFAIKVLPIIIFVGAFMALLYYFGIIQRAILLLNYLLHPILGTAGTETVGALASCFIGQAEGPLLIRPFLQNMTESQLFVVMVSGMGSISAALLAVYAALFTDHGLATAPLFTANLMAIPSSIIIAKILVPDGETRDSEEVELAPVKGNVFDAVSQGTADGLQVALNVGAMLIAFLSLIQLINICLLSLTTSFGLSAPLTLQKIFGMIFKPIGWLFGLTGTDALAAGELLGTRLIMNEMVAYTALVSMHLSPRANTLLTFALCGFANCASVGVQLGSLGTLVGNKRAIVARLSIYSLIGGTLANILNTCIAGLFL